MTTPLWATSRTTERAPTGSTSSVRRSRLLTPTIDAWADSAMLELICVMHLHECVQAECLCDIEELGCPLARAPITMSSTASAPCAASDEQLPLIDHEVLAEHGDVDRISDI